MPFDPSVISQIGEQPDFGAAVGKGFQLKDLANQTALSSIATRKARKDEEQSQFLSGLSKQYDITKPDQASKAASKASQAGYPDLATGVIKQSQSLQLGQAQIDEMRFQAGLQAQTRIDEGVQGVLAAVNAQISGPDGKPLLTPQGTEKYDSKTKDAMTLAGVLKLKRDLEDDETMSPEARKMAMTEVNKYLASGQPITYDGINQVARSTKVGREAFDKEIQRRKEVSAMEVQQEGVAERKRHDVATEQIAARKTSDAEKKSEQSGFSDMQESLLAEMALRSVNLPAGLRSQQQIKATLDGLIAKNPDKSPADIADQIKSGKLKLTAESKGAQTAGTQIGKVALTANELDTFGDQTIEASNAVPRGKFVPWNRLKNYSAAQLSDPDLLRFRAKMQALENAYEQLAARGGTDMEKRALIHQLFDNANSPQAVQSLVKALKEEASGAREAANRTIAETSGNAIPGTGGTQSTSAKPAGPAVGTVEQGYRYKGGDPGSPASWEKVGG